MRMTEEQLQALLARRSLPSQGVSRGSTPIASPAKRPKYGNRKVTDGEGNVHDSTKEFRLWTDLQLREKAGEIARLRRQVPFAFVVNDVLVCQYIADFVFDEGAARVVIDCKSPPTRKLAAYRIKAKLMQAIHGIQIREV
jgi:hypothetical protein